MSHSQSVVQNVPLLHPLNMQGEQMLPVLGQVPSCAVVALALAKDWMTV
jgi:hypothetical protein